MYPPATAPTYPRSQNACAYVMLSTHRAALSAAQVVPRLSANLQN